MTQQGPRCECADPACPECGNAYGQGSQCRKRAVTRLYRVDMEDRGGTWFCDRCGDDAIEAGVFTVKETDY